MTYEQLVKIAQQRCEQASDCPQLRLKMRQDFYQRHHFEDSQSFCFGQSEIDFLNWEIRRGVLNPTNSSNPGSQWWRNVNLYFIYLAELASLMHQYQVTHPNAPKATLLWLAFFKQPSAKNWYRAHNCAILAGFNKYKTNALNENSHERLFLNIVLYRLMFAQTLVENATIFGPLGSFISDPRGFAVKLIVNLAHFYPTNYPLTKQDIPKIHAEGDIINGIQVKLLDEQFILPNLKQLYEFSAKLNHAPFLTNYQFQGHPIYPLSMLKASQKVLVESMLDKVDVAISKITANRPTVPLAQ